jgi:putative hydrolase of the HAD superfamily
LYSARYRLEDNVYQRIAEFIAAYLGVSPEEGMRQRYEQIGQYGTALEWLRAEKGFMDIEAYYAAIHPPNEADSLPQDPKLRTFLESLHLPLGILTNSPREHADRILDKLGVSDLFTHVFDIRWNQFRGKPAPEAFRRVLEVLGTRPETTLFIDDMPRCVEGYCGIRGKGLLLDEGGIYPDYPGDRIRTLPELRFFLS